MARVIKGTRRPYTKADIAELRLLAGEGYTRSEMALITGRTGGSINGTCAYYGIHTHGDRVPHPPERLTEIARMRRAGLTIWKISHALGLSFDTVHNLCARHGIRRRVLHA